MLYIGYAMKTSLPAALPNVPERIIPTSHPKDTCASEPVVRPAEAVDSAAGPGAGLATPSDQLPAVAGPVDTGAGGRNVNAVPVSVYRCPKGHTDIHINTPLGQFAPNDGEVAVGSPQIPICCDCERDFLMEDMAIS